jgi:hypothetical protein
MSDLEDVWFGGCLIWRMSDLEDVWFGGCLIWRVPVDLDLSWGPHLTKGGPTRTSLVAETGPPQKALCMPCFYYLIIAESAIPRARFSSSASFCVCRTWAAANSRRNFSGKTQLSPSKILGIVYYITQPIHNRCRGEPGRVFSYIAGMSESGTTRFLSRLEARAWRSGFWAHDAWR